MLQFFCPNGHKIHCPEDRAGQADKCPKCGVKFRVPLPDVSEGAVDPASVSETSRKAGSSAATAPAASGVALGAAVADDQIEFLCPNNHLLHGPGSAQGRVGQCPECGSRFRIPTYDEDLDTQQEDTRPHFMPPLPTDSPLLPKPVADAVVEEEAPTALQFGAGEAGEAAAGHTLGELFARLWACKAQGATLEVRYADSQRITPDRFFKGLSKGTHGVFAVDEPNGTHTLTAVAWDSVSAVIVRGLKKLPADLLG
jgi:hypothetical protein